MERESTIGILIQSDGVRAERPDMCFDYIRVSHIYQCIRSVTYTQHIFLLKRYGCIPFSYNVCIGRRMVYIVLFEVNIGIVVFRPNRKMSMLRWQKFESSTADKIAS